MDAVTRQRPARGFSLVEVMIGSVIAFIVLGAATGVFVQVRQVAVEGALRAQLARDGQLLLDQLGRDLRYAGLGVPAGVGVDNGVAGEPMRPAVRRVMADNLVFFGDLPFPNAELPGIATIAAFKTDATGHRVVLLSEVSGNCPAPATAASNAFQCKTSASSLVPANYDSSDECRQGQVGARTCPWAMNKWLPQSPAQLTFVDASGAWYPREWAGLAEVEAMDNWVGVHLAHTTDRDLPRDAFFGPVAAGYVAHIDRVFWSFEDAAGNACAGGECFVRRRQCWGAMGNPNTGANATGTSPLRSTSEPPACAAPNNGTIWEDIAAHVESFAFTAYEDAVTAPPTPVATADLARVRAIEVQVTLAKTIGGRRVAHTAKERFFLEHRDQDAP